MKKRGHVTVDIIDENGSIDCREVSWEEGDTVNTLKRKIGSENDAVFLRLEKRDTSILDYIIEHKNGVMDNYYVELHHDFGEKENRHVPVDAVFSTEDYTLLEQIIKLGGEILYVTKDDTGKIVSYGRYLVIHKIS